MKKILGVLAVVLSLWPVSVWAIADADSAAINNVYAYRHVLENNDQLYLVDYSVNYAVLPTETITEAFIVRLRNGSTVYRSIAPYAYYTKGYGRGIAAIYFSATDAPAWSGAYTMEIAANPTLSWPGVPLLYPTGTFIWSTSSTMAQTQIELGERILTIAALLESAWTGENLVESVVGGNRLTTTDGEAYFPNAIENLRVMCPNIFQVALAQPTQPNEKTYSNSYGGSLASSLIGTPLDFTNMATSWGIPISYLTSIIWLILMGVVAFFVTRASKQFKWATVAMVPMLIFGGLLGMLSLYFLMGIGFLCALLIGMTFFYNPGNG